MGNRIANKCAIFQYRTHNATFYDIKWLPGCPDIGIFILVKQTLIQNLIQLPSTYH